MRNKRVAVLKKKGEAFPDDAEGEARQVRRIFSDKTLQSNPFRSFSYFVFDLVLFALLFLALWNTDRWYLLIPLWAAFGISSFGLFQLGHETAHGSLFKNSTLSWWMGQIAFLPSLHPYNQWVYGHNRIHHEHTVRLRGDLAWHPRSPERYAKMSAWDRFWHRIYWSSYGGGIYYLIKMWWQGLILHTVDFPGAKRDTRLVLHLWAIATAALFYASGAIPGGFDWRYGVWGTVKLGLVPFLILNYLIGITVYLHHIHPEIPWKREGEWSWFYGQVNSTTNYKGNSLLNFFIHNIFIHAPHHIHPGIPFYNLPRALEELKAEYGGELFERKSMLREYLLATRHCKLFDAESGRWVGYGELR